VPKRPRGALRYDARDSTQAAEWVIAGLRLRAARNHRRGHRGDAHGRCAHPSAAAGINPLDHYNQFGWHEGRDPSGNFDTTDYLGHYVDVANAHINPLIHFLQFGQAEGRSQFADGVWG
jgi:hypothetical protein